LTLLDYLKKIITIELNFLINYKLKYKNKDIIGSNKLFTLNDVIHCIIIINYLKLHGNVVILPNLHAVKQNRVKIGKLTEDQGTVRGRMFGFVVFRIIIHWLSYNKITKPSILI